MLPNPDQARTMRAFFVVFAPIMRQEQGLPRAKRTTCCLRAEGAKTAGAARSASTTCKRPESLGITSSKVRIWSNPPLRGGLRAPRLPLLDLSSDGHTPILGWVSVLTNP